MPRKNREHPERRPRGARFLLFLIVVVAIAFAYASGSGMIPWIPGTVSMFESKTVDYSFRNIGELATQVGYYTNVQVISNSREVFGLTVPFTQSNYIYSYDGVIKVGFDFEQIEVVTDDTLKTVTVRLPEPIVISNDIDEDSLQVYNESKNVFTPLKLSQINASQSTMKEEALQTAINNGIFETARNNAELLIGSFLSSSFNLQEYTILFE